MNDYKITEEQSEKNLERLLNKTKSLDELYEEIPKSLNTSYIPHYSGWSVGAFITDQNLNFYEGCIIKYICRYRKKDGMKDLKKAKDYLEQLIHEYDLTRT